MSRMFFEATMHRATVAHAIEGERRGGTRRAGAAARHLAAGRVTS
jgi:hypothetical protein